MSHEIESEQFWQKHKVETTQQTGETCVIKMQQNWLKISSLLVSLQNYGANSRHHEHSAEIKAPQFSKKRQTVKMNEFMRRIITFLRFFIYESHPKTVEVPFIAWRVSNGPDRSPR